MPQEDIWFTIYKGTGQRRMTPRGAKGVLIFIGFLLAMLLPLTPAILLVVFYPSWWWLIPLYLVWDAVLVTFLVRILRGHSEVIDLNAAVQALRDQERRAGGGYSG
jgi:hypothetical protein